MLLLKKLKSSQPLQNNNIMLFRYMFKQDCGISLLEVRYAINLKLIKPARIKKEPLHHIPTLTLWSQINYKLLSFIKLVFLMQARQVGTYKILTLRL